MAIDRYTKAVLTVTAGCLVWLSLGAPSLVAGVSAQLNHRAVAEVNPDATVGFGLQASGFRKYAGGLGVRRYSVAPLAVKS
jgi:hypothetical protein